MSDTREVQIRTDESGRESWAISLESATFIKTMRMTPDEARAVHAALGAVLGIQTDEPEWEYAAPWRADVRPGAKHDRFESEQYARHLVKNSHGGRVLMRRETAGDWQEAPRG